MYIIFEFFFFTEIRLNRILYYPPPPPPIECGVFWSYIPDPLFCFHPPKACCGRPSCPALYKNNLLTMTPTTKKSMMRSTLRALNPSSFFMATEGCWDDIMLLFLIRRPSSSWRRGEKRRGHKYDMMKDRKCVESGREVVVGEGKKQKERGDVMENQEDNMGKRDALFVNQSTRCLFISSKK